MPYDYTDAPPPQFELIPQDTVATVTMHIRAGGVGEDGMLKRSAKGDCEMLDCEFVVTDGACAKRKFWQYFVLEGTTDGHAEAAKISRGTLKAIIDGVLGLKPDDASAEARAARTVSVKWFDGKSFIAKIGIEKGGPDGKGGVYNDKNRLAGVITPDKKEWHPVEQPPPFDGGGSAAGGAAPPNAAPPSAAPPIQRPGSAT